MRKTLISTLLLFIAGSTLGAAADGNTGNIPEKFRKAPRKHVAVHTGAQKAMSAVMTPDATAGSTRAAAKAVPGRIVTTEPVKTLKTNSFAYTQGPDKKTWMYTESLTMRKDENGRNTYMYDKSAITVYDSEHNERGTVTIEIPADKQVNAIEPLSVLTNKFFDRDDTSIEMMVYVHYILAPGVTLDSTFVYSLEDGRKMHAYEGMADFTETSISSWETYQRLLISNETITDEEYFVKIDIYKPVGWNGSEPELEKTFDIDGELINYTEGPCFHAYGINGKPYYAISHYDKPWASGYQLDPETGMGLDPIPTENNFYVIETFDRNFNRIDSVAAPLTTAEDCFWPAFGAFGMFSDNDLSEGYYTGDGKLNYVITLYDYWRAIDDNRYYFQVYSDGKLVNTICDNVTDYWFHLADIKGQNEQWGFIQTIGNEQYLQMVDLPSCERKTRFPASIEGNNITSTVNRVPKGDSYLYAMKMAYGDVDSDNNIIAPIFWINPDLTVDHVTRINLGQNAENFNPNFADNCFNQYLADTDDEREFYILTKVKRNNSNVLDNVFDIVKENGDVVFHKSGDSEKDIIMVSILDQNTVKPEILVGYMDRMTGEFTLDYYSVPFSKFTAGGTGTEADPYLISTLGDMLQISSAPEAHYRLAADIDMTDYAGVWTPVETFSGTFDGAGHTLQNFVISDTENTKVGLFNTLAHGSKIRDLMIVNPTLVMSPRNNGAGILAGQAMRDSVSNVHVYGALIEGAGNSADAVGGLIGQATTFSDVRGSSFDGTIDVPASENVGGIIGLMRTGSTVSASLATGAYTAGSYLGGIAGTTERDATVTGCRTDVALKAQNFIGGIAGANDNRAAIANNTVAGSIEATAATRWGKLAVGGVVGELAYAATENIITGNIVTAEISYPADAEAKAVATVHRIAGYTVENESLEAGETAKTDPGLKDNYATTATPWNATDVILDDATSTEGATKTVAELTTEFLKGIGFAYGNTVAEPWTETGTLPVLFFENRPTVLVLSNSSVTVNKGETATITATIYGAEPGIIDVTSSDNAVAEAEIVDEGENSITIEIKCKDAGQAVITATAGTLTATCTVYAVSTGIAVVGTSGSDMAVRFAGGRITAAGAAALTVYNAAGQLVTSMAGESVDAAALGKGVYVIVAKDAAGRTATGKIAIR